MAVATRSFCGCSRWTGVRVALGGFLVHLSLGSIVSFGNMSPYLTSYMRKYGSAPSLTYTECAWIYATASMGQGSAIMIGGMIERLIGPKLTTILGGWFMSAGVLFTFFAVKHSFALTAITYGAVFGLGCGVAYASPLGCAMRWFPKRKGLVNGLVVAGFGGGAFIFNQVQTAFINPDNLKPDFDFNGDKYFSQDSVLDQVPWTFILLGSCYAVMQLIGSLLLCYPPDSELNGNNIIVEECGNQTTSFQEEEKRTPQQISESGQHVSSFGQQAEERLTNGLPPVGEVTTTETPETGQQLEEGSNSGPPPVVEDSTTCAVEAPNSLPKTENGLILVPPSVVEVSATSATSDPEPPESVQQLHDGLNPASPSLVEVTTTIGVAKPASTKTELGDDVTLKPLEVLRSRYFYCMWLMFVFNGQGIIFVSTLYKAYGQTFISDDTFMALVGSFGSVLNAGGRIFWGVLADKFSFRVSSLIMSAAFTCLMLTLQLSERGGKPLFFIYVCLLFGSFSGSYALFPTATAKCFGRKYLSINYGLVFTSQVITAPLGVFLSQSLKSSLGWDGLFFLVAGCSFVSLILAFLFNAKDKLGNEI